MARIRRSAELGSPEARRTLRARPEPYWMQIDRGLALGYRKSREGGAWLMRRYVAAPQAGRPGRFRHAEQRIGTANDSRDPDGHEVLDFGQAQRKLLALARHEVLRASGQLYTVADAVEDYLDWLRAQRKSADDTAYKLKAYVLPELGTKRVVDLKPADFDAWLAAALKRRRKVAKPKKPRASRATEGGEAGASSAVAVPEDPGERQRRRKATLNRVIAALKGCLNRAHATRKVPSREAWAYLKKFGSADSARLRWLNVEEARRLQNAADPALRSLIAAALNTGCRAGELLAMRAGDFDPASKTVLIAQSKSGKSRRVPLTERGVELFDQLTAGKLESDAIFRRSDGSAWYGMALVRLMAEASKNGKVVPPATFHTLRHSYASALVQEGVPLMFVASALGHRDTRMVEKHYGHLAHSAVAEMIRAKLPNFEAAAAQSKVTSLRGAQSA